MKSRSILSTLFLSAFVSSGLHAKDKIVGGERVTDLNEVKFMVSLSKVCGGSIIAKKWVLTAAHCAGYFSSAKGGILNLKETGFSYKVKRVIKHPEYNYNTFSHDFALVELETEIDFEATGLKTIKLADEKFARDGHQDPGVDSTVFGFGNLSAGESNRAQDLNKVVVPIVSHDEANKEDSYNGQIDGTMLPAGYAGGGKDSCQGDSGGPLVVFDGNNDPIQVGVVSWGEGCAGPDKYGIYSNVSVANKWIKNTISGSDEI